MQNRLARVLERHCVWLSLLLHIIFLLSLSLGLSFNAKIPAEKPFLFVPSYLKQEQASPVMQQQEQQNNVPLTNTKNEKAATNTNKTNMGSVKNLNRNKPIDISSTEDQEPVHLVGDKKLDQPILALLGKALTAHLVYPKAAIDLNVKGTAIIGFMLYPDGHITELKLLQSSSADVLDKAAINAASAISPVMKVDKYLTKPEFLVIGIIFG